MRTVNVLVSLAFLSMPVAQAAPIILPGAPGQGAQELTPEEAIEIADTSYTRDDARFMRDMIPHHQQAVVMAELVGERTNNEEVKEIAGRILTAQADEIVFMTGWLTERGEEVPSPHDAHQMHTSHDMAGMASPEDLERLRGSEGVEFDRLFLTLMIAHHEGALEMVEDLLDQPGAAYDPVLFEFVNDVDKDQSSEIDQMNKMLVALSPDPRANLAAGFEDAEQAILNMMLIAALPKPPGFFDPKNPAGMPLAKPKKEDEDASPDALPEVHEGHHQNHAEHMGEMPADDVELAMTPQTMKMRARLANRWMSRAMMTMSGATVHRSSAFQIPIWRSVATF